MNYAQAEKMLKSCGQEHVLAYWKRLSKKEQSDLLEQVAKIEPKNVKYCQSALHSHGKYYSMGNELGKFGYSIKK